MSTSFVLRNTVFTNKNLPISANFVQDGLIAAFRPTTSASSLIDLSGNGYKATVIGSPTFSDGFISGFAKNGFRIEAAETTSQTLFVVARVGYNAERNSSMCTPLFSRWDTSGSLRGSGIFLSSNTRRFYPNYQVYAKSTTDGADVNKYGYANYVVHNMATDTDTTKSEWLFIAETFDAATDSVTIYVPRYDIEAVFPITGATLQGRRITNSANGQMNRFEVCSAGGYSSANGSCDVAEALIYNKVLTKTQILEQYLYSKDFFEKHRSVVI